MIRLHRSRCQKGYTLAELIAVVGIIGILAVVTIPRFVKISQRQRLTSAAHEVQQALLAARMRAVRANQNASLVFTAASGSEVNHHLDLVAPDNSPLPTPTPVSKGLLPANAFFFVATPTESKVTFAGDGRMISELVPAPAIITVQGPVGAGVTNQVTIKTSTSGKVEVVTPVVWQ